jgi:thiamine transporter
MRSERVKVLVEVALAVALSAVLNLIGLRLPWNIAGGRVALDMLPIFVVALRHGLLAGVVTGALWGMFDLLFEPFVVHPVQLLLDYPLAFALCGLAGLGAWRVTALVSEGRLTQAGIETVPWVLLGSAGRFASHFVSGVIFSAANAPEGQPVWLYSALYNLSHLLPSVIATAAIAAVIVPALGTAVPVTSRQRP